MAGYFITFEGGEGAGKTTQLQLLKEYFEHLHRDVVITREPGGTPAAESIRPLLVSGTYNWDSLSEMLLFSAARRHHLQNKILPALRENKIVLCDRFADSTMAYQGYGRGKDLLLQSQLQQLYHLIAGNFEPNLTFIFDIDPQIGLKRSMERCGNTEQRFENMDLQFHQNLRQGFMDIAKNNPNRCVIIDANQDISTIHHQIVNKIREKLCLI